MSDGCGWIWIEKPAHLDLIHSVYLSWFVHTHTHNHLQNQTTNTPQPITSTPRHHVQRQQGVSVVPASRGVRGVSRGPPERAPPPVWPSGTITIILMHKHMHTNKYINTYLSNTHAYTHFLLAHVLTHVLTELVFVSGVMPHMLGRLGQGRIAAAMLPLSNGSDVLYSGDIALLVIIRISTGNVIRLGEHIQCCVICVFGCFVALSSL